MPAKALGRLPVLEADLHLRQRRVVLASIRMTWNVGAPVAPAISAMARISPHAVAAAASVSAVTVTCPPPLSRRIA